MIITFFKPEFVSYGEIIVVSLY